MNFEKEAREAFNYICGTADACGPFKEGDRTDRKYCECRYELEQALRRAFIAGQEEMRERAAVFVKPSKGAPCDCVGQYETDLGPRWHAVCDCRNVGDTAEINIWCAGMNEAARIRSLPLQSNDEKELG